MVAALAACASPRPHKIATGPDDLECGVDASVKDERCFPRTPQVSAAPPYTLHFVEFDDQGWLYPGPGDDGYVPEMGLAHAQLDRAVNDISSRLAKDERVLLLVYVHGWKHSAAHDDRDVKRFRQMLSEAALLDRLQQASGAESGPARRVVGIYVGWRGAGRLSPTNPLINLSFWTRKNAALHVSEGAPRELFARIRALRERWNAVDDSRPRLRTAVIGHSFGGWLVFSALSPAILELFAQRTDIDAASDARGAAEAWRRARLRSAADIVILVNPAFEASRYQPIHKLAQRVRLPAYEPPALLLVTSNADQATGMAFPLGRFFNTIFQKPFVSDEEEYAAKHTPGFVPSYVTHRLSGDGAKAPECPDWRSGPGPDPNAEPEAVRLKRMRGNALQEKRRHDAWEAYLARSNRVLPAGWQWQYCGGTTLVHEAHAPHSPVWNVVTDAAVIADHNDIMGEPLHAFFRQLYLDLPH
jgi:hypothetical protein